MEKYIYNEQNGLWYELQGDYYLPCLKLPEEETAHIGIWGQRHRRYLKTHRKALYTSLAGKAAFRKRGCDRNAQSGKPNAMGAEDEQSAQHRYGNRFEYADLHITNTY